MKSATTSRPMIFCNTGWMKNYTGLDPENDPLLNGGTYVKKTGKGAEVCNFVVANDGKVYGYVETIKRKVDRQINIDKVGAVRKEKAERVDVILTATNPAGGRFVVGYYLNATLFRNRVRFKKAPSALHRQNRLTDYRFTTSADFARCLPEDERFQMPTGKGWMGQTPWWFPPNEPTREHRTFLKRVEALILSHSPSISGSNRQKNPQPEAAALTYEEGPCGQVTLSKWERSPAARRACLAHHGSYACQICGFDFERVYGTLGREFIHVHHLNPGAQAGETKINPAIDLLPVCPNCHGMIHRKKEVVSPDDLKMLIAQQRES